MKQIFLITLIKFTLVALKLFPLSLTSKWMETLPAKKKAIFLTHLPNNFP